MIKRKQLKPLAKPKILVPLVLLLWLVVSLPLSVSQAEPVDDSACSATSNWSKGVWGMKDSPAHLTLVDPNNACYEVSGTLVWGEWWRDNPNDCDRTNAQTAYNTCSDSDMNWYLRLDDPTSVGVTPTEINQLQRWGQCKAGYTDKLKWCNFLTETIPQGGNYGMWDSTIYDWDPTNDQPQLPNPCLDKDWGGQPISVPPCKGTNIQIAYTGARVFDNNHGWKEIHPVRKEVWTDASGSHCYSVNEANQASPTTCTVSIPDTTAPTTTATATTSDGATYTSGTWTNKEVTLNLSAIDEQGGSGVKEITYSINAGQPTTVSGSSALVNVATEGQTTIVYYATDNAGNKESNQTFTVKLDKAAPDTTITKSPSDVSGSPTATFEFSSSESGSTFRCALDSSSYNSCTSPKSYSALSDGSHTFYVKATDAAGNTDSTPATRTWTVYSGTTDTIAPTVQSSVPIPDKTGVRRGTNIQITFSEQMDKSTLFYSPGLSNAEVYRKNSDGTFTSIPAAAAFSTDDMITLNPNNRLAKKKWHLVKLWNGSTGLKDPAGNPLDAGGNYLDDESGYVYFWFKTGRR